MKASRRVRVEGIVQGVGFRPFVYALAERYALAGQIRNDAAGVSIDIEGDEPALDGFLRSLRGDAPALAVIDAVRWQPQPLAGFRDFTIAASRSAPARRALISPDTSTCADCLRELFDPVGPPLPLPVHQLHELRPALHDHRRRAVRPRAHDDGGVHDVRRLPRRSTRTRATAASTRSRTPAPTAARGSPRSTPTAREIARGDPIGRARARSATARSSPSKASAAITSPATRSTGRRAAPARAQAPRGQAVRGDGPRLARRCAAALHRSTPRRKRC